MEKLSYSELRRLQAKERASSDLVALPEDFYEKAKDLLKAYAGQLHENFSLEAARERENIIKVLRDIHSKRVQKIVFKALRVAGSSVESAAGLTKEEERMFEGIVGVIREEQQEFESLISQLPTTEKELRDGAKKEEVHEKKTGKQLKFLMDIPVFVGTDMNKYGPFSTGEVAILPDAEAEVLLRRKVAELGE